MAKSIRIEKHGYEESGSSLYLVLDCEESSYKKVKLILSNKGFTIRSSGSSYRPASDGFQYDYYIRIEKEGRKATKREIEHVLSEIPTTDQLFISQDFSAMNLRLQEVEYQINRIGPQLLVMKQGIEEKITVDSSRIQRSIMESFKSVIRNESESIVQKIESGIHREDKELTKQKIQLGVMYEELEKLHKAEIEEKDSEIDRLNLEIGKLQFEVGNRQVYSAQRDSHERMLEILLPKVKFLKHSIDVMFFEYKEYVNALETIRKIVACEEKSKRVQGADQWLECRCGTGEGPSGRIYFKRTNEETIVLISHKRDQDEDIRYLKTI